MSGFYDWYGSLQWRQNGRDTISNHQPHDCLLSRLSRRRSKKTSMLCVTGLCLGNSPGTVEFPAQMVSNAENVSIWWRHHVNVMQLNITLYNRLSTCEMHRCKPCVSWLKVRCYRVTSNTFTCIIQPWYRCRMAWCIQRKICTQVFFSSACNGR